MLETLKKLMDNLVSLFHKIKCSMSCCTTNINIMPKSPQLVGSRTAHSL